MENIVDKLKYQEAVKTAQTMKPKEGYMVIEFGYSNRVIVPHKDGINLLLALNAAEHFEDNYSGVARITPFDRSKLSASLMSVEEYHQYKIAALLNIPVKDLKEYENQAT